ncbi:MAG: GH3 auxin-responsive promoter family protein [Bacteroidota bacterium]
MKLLVHKIANWFLKRRMEHIEHAARYPHETQEQLFHRLMNRGKDTAFGEKYGFEDELSIETFRQRVPISAYEDFHPWIERMFQGEANVLWPGRIGWFAKSSGTTNDKSKFIPVSPEALDECHFKAGQDMLSLYLHNKPDSKLFAGKTLSIGGSHQINKLNQFVRYGDVSAVILENLPRFYELVRTPSKAVALMDEWESKLAAMAKEVADEDVTSLVGVPTWTLVLIHRLMEDRGISDLKELWPNLELYCHGGVSFEPYRDQFKAVIKDPEMSYIDCYNASEGFFAVQHELDARDMLLMLDYGIFYEFLPMEEWDKEFPQTVLLHEVELGKPYALVISTNAGLWRYNIGDTITFTGKNPYRIKVSGRTKHFINAFGEELMVENAELAIAEACRVTGAKVDNYTAAPIYFKGNQNGGHEWLIEFVQPPQHLPQFVEVLDGTLKTLNSDYEAKRQKDIALTMPTVHSVPRGTFHAWLKKKGKLGGQHKVPRLANHRDYVDDILAMMVGA